ncbi:YjbH domain-containing protein [Aestuariibius sp. HNIBRBA575]|uniref:YjbH domain-containing protein n=1 Tax=Aestuariibius sp. HNIBRBA575 TaxID=3233343 RepID=UPI0034A50FEF
MKTTTFLTFGVASIALFSATASFAQDSWISSYNYYGAPGLLDLPTAIAPEEGEIAATLSYTPTHLRNTISFQITPRLSGSFRYSRNNDYNPEGSGHDPLFDRSFDLRYQLVEEGEHIPAVTIGLQDFIGTGVYTSEYLVATKTLSPNVRVTGGIGWGRLGSYNGFENPFGATDRGEFEFDEGGDLLFDQYFQGDAALFGGVEYRYSDTLTFKAEYSSDAYTRETTNGEFEHQSPLNFGVAWQPRPGYQVSLSYMNGHELALAGTVMMNPHNRGSGSGFDPAPAPVSVRGAHDRAALSWDRNIRSEASIRAQLQQVLAVEGITLISVQLTDRQVRVRYSNSRYRSEAQALGRVARILTHVMPASVEVFILEPAQRGLPLSSTTLRRSDIETLENEPGAAQAIFDRAAFDHAGPNAGLVAVDAADGAAFTWGLSPYTEISLFDGDEPIRGEVGLELSGRYTIQPNLVLSGRARAALWSGYEDAGSISASTLPAVRRDALQYAVDGNPGIEEFTLAWYGRAAPDVYTRVTAGYLETMYGGVSAEVLWKPVESRLGLGAELNYVAKRDYDMLLGFQDYETVTGHVSAYYDFGEGWHGQLDVGRYLAEDFGATLSVDREFTNGWRLGAYVTQTDVSAEEFGEGSFDKGIRLTIPFDWLMGAPTRSQSSVSLASLSRDGGARVDVDGRLYDTLRDGHLGDMTDEWGRFWR